MMWSQLRVKARANLCDRLRDRMDFHVAVYRDSHDSDYGRAWISIDGEQVASWSCFEQLLHPVALEELKARFPQGWTPLEYDRFVAERGICSKKQFTRLMAEYLSMDPQEALGSAVPLTRLLAMSDRRIGTRTLTRFDISKEQDPMVQLVYRLRTSGPVDRGVGS